MKKYRALGLMSGTSLDGIDVALIETDGFNHAVPLGFAFYPYDKSFRDELRGCFGIKDVAREPRAQNVERLLTDRHADAVRAFLTEHGERVTDIDIIGFHGQTIWHNPAHGQTVQLGDGARLAKKTGTITVNDFRSADVRAGGEGAPLAPLYHHALASEMLKPVAIINIGGVSNITWIGENEKDILAFDMGTGNALIDDYVLRGTGQPFDKGGALAMAGQVDQALLDKFLAHVFFKKSPPKSLDRDVFSSFMPEGLSIEDGAATLTQMTVSAISEGLKHVPVTPKALYITGGGRHNSYMMMLLEKQSGVNVQPVEVIGLNGDALEAEAFAYLAVRSILDEPLSLPTTTSVKEPMTGGVVHKPEEQ